jgi:hypothetical protein
MTEDGTQLLDTPEARQGLAALLDEVVPPSPDGRLPGAGALGLDDALREAARERPELAPMLVDALSRLDGRARARGAPSFAASSPPARRDAVVALAEESPALLPTLTFLVCTRYYREPAVLRALDLEARPPHPAGYPVPPTDFAILEPVRRRASMVRDAKG